MIRSNKHESLSFLLEGVGVCIGKRFNFFRRSVDFFWSTLAMKGRQSRTNIRRDHVPVRPRVGSDCERIEREPSRWKYLQVMSRSGNKTWLVVESSARVWFLLTTSAVTKARYFSFPWNRHRDFRRRVSTSYRRVSVRHTGGPTSWNFLNCWIRCASIGTLIDTQWHCFLF